ncbi:EndoU domain-containing protein [Streptomyces sp. NPDC092296]|uniref:EndoU domain-containing protein n=1 Tax=Streptomyces sp. NPDC092296 TaxID=3366012 RepID=UPI00381EFB44
MADTPEPYDPRTVYGQEASGRGASRGRYGGWEDAEVRGEEIAITPELRERASYLSPYRMDHIAELHSDRASARGLGKSLFPAHWTDDAIFTAAQAVASDPAAAWSRDGKTGGEPETLFNPWHDLPDVEWAIPARFRVDGLYDGVRLRVIVEPYGEGIVSAYPLMY